MRVAIIAAGRAVLGHLVRVRVDVRSLSAALSLLFIVSACTTNRETPPAAVSPVLAATQKVAALPMPAEPIASPSKAASKPVPPWARVKISDVASRFGFASYKVHGKRIALRGESRVLEMEGDSRRASFNGVVFWLSAAPLRSWGRWTMLQSDVDKMLAVLVQPSQAVKAKGYRTVVLDAGHGGEDPGAANARYGIQEKRITLALANATRDILRQRGVDVHVTRTGDRTLDLEERCQYATRVRADVFVSIHLNSAADPDSSGIETHILPPAGQPITASASVRPRDQAAYPGNSHDGANLVLGYSLQKSLLKHTGAEDRGVRRSRFCVVRSAPCPAALVECGFVSNRKEAQKLLTQEHQDRVARALAEGVLAYLDTVRRAQPVRLSTSCVGRLHDSSI